MSIFTAIGLLGLVISIILLGSTVRDLRTQLLDLQKRFSSHREASGKAQANLRLRIYNLERKL